MGTVDFTGNYQDLSTDRGYQFKFYCEKCGNGYMSTFQSSKLGLAASAAEVAGSLFGGLFGKVSDTAYQIQRAVGGPAHDAALQRGDRGDPPPVQAVHALREVGLRAGLLQRQGGPLRVVRTGPRRGDRLRPGRGREAAGHPEGPGSRLGQEPRPRPGHRRHLQVLRRQDRRRQVLPRVRHLDSAEEALHGLRR